MTNALCAIHDLPSGISLENPLRLHQRVEMKYWSDAFLARSHELRPTHNAFDERSDASIRCQLSPCCWRSAASLSKSRAGLGSPTRLGCRPCLQPADPTLPLSRRA